MASESIAHSAFGLMGYCLGGHEGLRNKRSKHFPFGDYFTNFHNLFSWWCIDFVERKLMSFIIEFFFLSSLSKVNRHGFLWGRMFAISQTRVPNVLSRIPYERGLVSLWPRGYPINSWYVCPRQDLKPNLFQPKLLECDAIIWQQEIMS